MNCLKPVKIQVANTPANLSRFPDGLEVPCGKCLHCRIRKRSEWALRCWHENTTSDKSAFVTLTYNDNFLPLFKSLQQNDLQNYFKRLRKNVDTKIRYFAAGEYGDPPKTLYKYGYSFRTEGDRPHYHILLWGLGLSKMDRDIIKGCWSLDGEEIGNVHFGIVQPDSIRYVCQYIDKKFSGPLADIEYKNKNREPVFKICSQGIGKDWMNANAQQLKDNQSTSMYGHPVALPRYYINKLNIDTTNARESALQKNRELVESFTGVNITKQELLRANIPESTKLKNMDDRIEKARIQHDKNLHARISLKKRKL